jgi:hypothetical protein
MSFIGSIIGGGASLLGGLLNSGAASTAAGQEESAANSATQAQTGITNQQLSMIQGNTAPYTAAGSSAMSGILSMLGLGSNGGLGAGGTGGVNDWKVQNAIENTPGYKFNLSQGQQAIKNGAAGSTGISSASLTGLNNYSAGQASNYWSQYLGQLGSVAGMGESAALGSSQLQTGALGQLAGEVGSNMIGAGNAAAGGTIGSMNSIVGGINGAAGYGYLGSLGGGNGGYTYTPTSNSGFNSNGGVAQYNTSNGMYGGVG